METYLNWPEIGILIVLVGGFIISLTVIRSIFLYMIVIFLIGAMFGRKLYDLKRNAKGVWIIVMAVFFIGYSLANIIAGYTSILAVGGLYLFGIWSSYMLHEKNVIRSI